LELSEDFDQLVLLTGKVIHVLNSNNLRAFFTFSHVNFAVATLSNFSDNMVVLEHILPEVLEAQWIDLLISFLYLG